mmetsp:Transcript_48991/g.158298  ORF Transcript_48991/g.158298 Transcript_48991/m.158298 type:complete len:281 (-) Transcript_48991:484-1326(-)
MVVLRDEERRENQRVHRPHGDQAEGEHGALVLLNDCIEILLDAELFVLVGVVNQPRLEVRQDVVQSLVLEVLEEHLVQVQDEGQCGHVDDHILDSGRLHQEHDAVLCGLFPNEELGEHDDDEVDDLPILGHASDFELDEVCLTAIEYLLDLFLGGPLWDPVLDPRLCLGGHIPQDLEEVNGCPQVGHHTHHEDEDVHDAHPIVLQTILTRVDLLLDLVGLVREENLQGVSDVGACRPRTIVVHPARVLVVRAARTDAIGTVWARVHIGNCTSSSPRRTCP